MLVSHGHMIKHVAIKVNKLDFDISTQIKTSEKEFAPKDIYIMIQFKCFKIKRYRGGKIALS